MKHLALLFFLTIMWLGNAAQTIDLGNRRELFVDDYLIEKLEGAELELQKPVPAGVVFRLDKPWEGIVSGYFTILEEGGKYHMYYRGRPSTTHADASEEAHEVSCYATSTDGIHWTRPNLGLFEIAGTRSNNVIMVEPKNVTHNLAPFIDTKPGTYKDARFKAVGGTGSDGLFGFVSSDGVHWKPVRKEPLIKKGAFDSQNVVFWSESEKIYVCYFRTWKNDVRWIARSTSPDFLNWSEPVDVSFGDAPDEHLYTNQTIPYFRAPHIYISIAARFQPNRRALSEAQVAAIDLDNPANYGGLKNEISDAVFMTSRGCNHISRYFLESFIRPGRSLRNWVARSNYPVRGMVQTAQDEISIYIQRDYGQPSAHIERFTVRVDGFSSLSAGAKPGRMTSKPFRFSGKELEINYATSAAGAIQAEIQDENGKALAGFSLADSPEIIGDEIERTVRWKAGSDLSSLTGKTVKLHVRLKDADLYSIRFR